MEHQEKKPEQKNKRELENNREYAEMDHLFDRLWPICRSITGPGLRETLTILSEYIPLEQFGVRSGSKLFDWEVPKEWHVTEAWLKGPDGQKIVDFKDSNLHIVNYSAPINQKLSLAELRKHIHTIPHLPEAVPYVTSYYKERWGFCMAHQVLENLADGEYHAYINSRFVDGELNYAHAILPGESKQEILISTYVCHPSLANNELSGPIVATYLYRRLAQWTKRRFTYRFVFAPETIGSIAYLHRFGSELKERLYTGLVLTCLGGQESLSFKASKREDAPINLIVNHLFNHSHLEGRIRPFTPTHGSDERQYCSPGFNLPVGQMARSVYGSYPGYHNSLDNKESMTISALLQSVDELEAVLKALELDGYYFNQFPYGEVKLDQYQLYPDLNGPSMRGRSHNDLADQRRQLNRILMILNYSDGEHTLSEIAEKCKCSIFEMQPIIELLMEKGLLKGPFVERGPLT